MCVVSTVIDGWRDPSWPYFVPVPTLPSLPQPHTQPAPAGPNAVPWNIIQQDPMLAQQMLDVLKRLEAIDKRLGQMEQCKVSAKEKKALKARLRRIAKKAR
jgi:hypothetical protein